MEFLLVTTLILDILCRLRCSSSDSALGSLLTEHLGTERGNRNLGSQKYIVPLDTCFSGSPFPEEDSSQIDVIYHSQPLYWEVVDNNDYKFLKTKLKSILYFNLFGISISRGYAAVQQLLIMNLFSNNF